MLGSLSGCYASIGPTVGIDLPTGRATVGIEASAESFTVAHSIALGARPLGAPAEKKPASKYWTSRTSLLWEPGLGAPLDDTDHHFSFLGGGGSLGVRFDRYDDAPMRADLSIGAWAAAVMHVPGFCLDIFGDEAR